MKIKIEKQVYNCLVKKLQAIIMKLLKINYMRNVYFF